MGHVLSINSSAAVNGSKTRAGVAAVVQALNPSRVTDRDLNDSLPHITGAWAAARLVPAADRTADDHAILAQSDALVAELQAADTIVIGAPLYNFSVPASLKAWVDLIARPKLTFQYTENGPQGLLTGKRAIVVMASGGVPIDSPVDFATPWLRQVLGFIGITDVTVIDTKDPAHLEQIAALAPATAA